MTTELEFILWNPSTGVSIELPKINSRSYFSRFGLGWDEESDATRCLCFCPMGQVKFIVQRKMSGEHFKLSGLENRTLEHGVFVSGKLHWLRSRKSRLHVYVDEIEERRVENH